jgi:hypothetical protein
MTENREANLQHCGDQNRLLLATAMSRRPVVLRLSVSSVSWGERMVIFRKLGKKVVFRVGCVRSY